MKQLKVNMHSYIIVHSRITNRTLVPSSGSHVLNDKS